MNGMNTKQGRPKKKVVVFIKNPTDPSSYFRISQYLNGRNDVEFCCYSSDQLYRWYYNVGTKQCQSMNAYRKLIRKCILAFYGILHNSYQIYKYCRAEVDYVIVSRAVFPRIFPGFVVPLLKRLFQNAIVIWDFDDNIITNQEITSKEVNLLCNYADHIILSNEYLKGTLPQNVYDKVKILCTTDKTFEESEITTFISDRVESYSEQIILIWVGTRDNLQYLETILKSLDETAKELYEQSKKKMILWCISNGQIANSCQWLEVQNIMWNRQIANELLTKAHIGLMPLTTSEYTLGKAGFKAVQYIASGMPAVVSNVGYCKEVIEDGMNGYLVNSEEDWKRAILKLSTSREHYLDCSYHARDQWEEKFHSNTNQRFWEGIIHHELKD